MSLGWFNPTEPPRTTYPQIATSTSTRYRDVVGKNCIDYVKYVGFAYSCYAFTVRIIVDYYEQGYFVQLASLIPNLPAPFGWPCVAAE